MGTRETPDGWVLKVYTVGNVSEDIIKTAVGIADLKLISNERNHDVALAVITDYDERSWRVGLWWWHTKATLWSHTILIPKDNIAGRFTPLETLLMEEIIILYHEARSWRILVLDPNKKPNMEKYLRDQMESVKG